MCQYVLNRHAEWLKRKLLLTVELPKTSLIGDLQKHSKSRQRSSHAHKRFIMDGMENKAGVIEKHVKL
jgi:hypothetical protein